MQGEAGPVLQVKQPGGVAAAEGDLPATVDRGAAVDRFLAGEGNGVAAAAVEADAAAAGQSGVEGGFGAAAGGAGAYHACTLGGFCGEQ